MTAIFLAGGENPSHLQILTGCGAQRVAVNVASLLRRRSNWVLDLPVSEWEWIAYADAPVSEDDLELVISWATKPPVAVVGPQTWMERGDFFPLWNGQEALPEHRDVGFVVTDQVFKDPKLLRKALGASTFKSSVGVITGSIDHAISKFDFVISAAWWSVMKYGETQVWDGRKMHRYNADRQDEVRDRHRHDIEGLGVDYQAVIDGDADEVARLAVLSWREYESSLNPKQSGEASIDTESDTPETGTTEIALDTPPSPGRHRTLLPVLGMETVATSYRQTDGSEVIEDHSILVNVNDSIRQCDNCFLAKAGCPAFSAGSACGYSIPVAIQTKDQLQSVMSAMIEMQTQRVLMSRFAEEILGQELSPEVGRELERLFALIERMRNISDNRDQLKLTIESKGNAGVLSRLFGEKVGANAMVLPTPVESEDIMDAIIED